MTEPKWNEAYKELEDGDVDQLCHVHIGAVEAGVCYIAFLDGVLKDRVYHIHTEENL